MNPAGWETDAPEATDGTGRAHAEGLYDMDVVVNAATSITCVALPAFDPKNPMRGTKQARESLIKLLTGMFDDVNPLNYRTAEERDHVTPDPYFKVAPGWSTLSGGRRPYVTAAPADIVEKLQRAANCVPLIRSVRVFVLNPQGFRSQVTLEELIEKAITVQEVPNLYKKAAAAAAAAGGGAGASNAIGTPSIDLTPLTQKQIALEQQVAQMQQLLEKIAAAAVPAAPAASAPAPSAEPVAVHDDNDDDDMHMSSKRRGKRPRVVSDDA